MIAPWTAARRRALEEAAARHTPDPAEVEQIAWCLARDWGQAMPAAWREIPLVPLVEHKLYRYAVRLRDAVDFVLRGTAATDRLFSGKPPRLLLGLHADTPLDHVAIHRLRAHGAHLLAWPRAQHRLHLRKIAPEETAHTDCWLDALPPLPAPAAPPSPCPVLFVASTANYLNPMLPLLRALRDTGRGVALIAPRIARQWPQFAAIPADVHVTFLEDCFDLAAAEARKALREAAQHAPPFGAHWTVQGVPLRPLIAAELDRFQSLHPPEAAALIEIARAALARLGTRLVVCARQRRALEIAFVRTAHQHSLKTAMIIHGHLAFDAPDAYFIYGSFEALDRVLVWGNDQRDRLLCARNPCAGLPLRDPQIVVTGNPAWDELAGRRWTASRRAEARANLASQLGLDPARPWITLATQDITRTQYPDILEALHPLDIQLLVKVHPAEDPAAYAPKPEHDKVRVLRPRETDLHHLLAASDLLITYSSTVNLEALLLGTPVLTAALRPEIRERDRLLRLDDFGLPYADTAAALRRAVESLLAPTDPPQTFSPDRCRAIAAHFLANAEDAAATPRALAAIQELL